MRASMLGAYLEYWRINLLTVLEYRTNAFLWFAFNVVYHGTALGALVVTMGRFPSMAGWNIREMFFLYALWMMASELHFALFIGAVNVPDIIREGKFDRFMVRPRDILFQVITVPQAIMPDGFVMACITFIVAAHFAGVALTAATLGLVALVVLGGALIDFGISILVATVAFWFVRVDSLRWAVIGLEQDFTRYPITIYSRGVQAVLTFALPFAFMNYFPAAALLHKSSAALGLSPMIGFATPLVGLAWFAVAYFLWTIGLRHYQGTGS